MNCDIRRQVVNNVDNNELKALYKKNTKNVKNSVKDIAKRN